MNVKAKVKSGWSKTKKWCSENKEFLFGVACATTGAVIGVKLADDKLRRDGYLCKDEGERNMINYRRDQLERGVDYTEYLSTPVTVGAFSEKLTGSNEASLNNDDSVTGAYVFIRKR